VLVNGQGEHGATVREKPFQFDFGDEIRGGAAVIWWGGGWQGVRLIAAGGGAARLGYFFGGRDCPGFGLIILNEVEGWL
jgi:hypothetical protein